MKQTAQPPVWRPVAALLVLPVVLAGCGGGLMAPDPWREDPGSEQFLDRVSKTCATKTIGGNTLADLIDGFQNDSRTDYFIDLTTKLYFGKVSQGDYAGDVDAFFPAGDNKEGLDCIFSELRGGAESR